MNPSNHSGIHVHGRMVLAWMLAVFFGIAAEAWVPPSGGGNRPTVRLPVATTDSVDEKISPMQLQPSSAWMELDRTLELLGITWNDFLSPILQGVLQPDNETPLDWDGFWELSLKPQTAVMSTKIQRSPPNATSTAEQFAHYLERMGPTYAKIGQALSSRPDIVPRSLAIALTRLQDDIEVVSTKQSKDWGRLDRAEGARDILRYEYKTSDPFSDETEMETFLESLSETPVAAASIGVVYSGFFNGQKVAIKIQRPDVQEIVQKDARLLRRIAELVEAIPSLREGGEENDRFVRTNVTGAVDEFMTRLGEELNYQREADNLELFGKLYSHRRPKQQKQSQNTAFETSHIQVVVPEVYRKLCTDRILVMEWIDGIKLVDLQQEQWKQERDGNGNEEALKKSKEETLQLIQQGIDCTLSQLLETGVLHADPHGGNLLKVAADESSASFRLGYIDFGLLSTIPTTVQDGLICAVCQLIFAKNVTAVGELFGELQLLPEDILEDPVESQALADELTSAISKVLVFPSNGIPSLRFDKLLDVLTRLVPRFRFQLPPYFLNNARALATLEGMAREVDPNFNILRHLYPYAISRIFSNPTDSPVVEKTLKSLVENPTTGKLDLRKLRSLLKDASSYSGYSKRRVVQDIARSKSGPKLVGRLMSEQSVSRVVDRIRNQNAGTVHYKPWSKRRRRRRVLDKLANYLRL